MAKPIDPGVNIMQDIVRDRYFCLNRLCQLILNMRDERITQVAKTRVP